MEVKEGWVPAGGKGCLKYVVTARLCACLKVLLLIDKKKTREGVTNLDAVITHASGHTNHVGNGGYQHTYIVGTEPPAVTHSFLFSISANSKVSSMARSLVKILKQEMSEIETCPDCYMNAHQNPKSWFTEVCVSI